VPTLRAADTTFVCSRITIQHIQHLHAVGNLAELKRLAQRPGDNALYDIDCGNDPYGIFSMIHTEGLHTLEVGIVPYILEILMKSIPGHLST